MAQCTSQNAKVIALQPLGVCDQLELDSLADALGKNYGCTVEIMDAIPIPEAFFIQVKSPRYRADSLLIYLNTIKPAHCTHILGVCTVDISTTKRDADGQVLQPAERYQDWGVFGLGQRPGTAAVISSYRIPKAQASQYLTKVALHEFGHNLGLAHCTQDVNCIMRDAAEKLSTLDKVGTELCSHCKERAGIQP